MGVFSTTVEFTTVDSDSDSERVCATGVFSTTVEFTGAKNAFSTTVEFTTAFSTTVVFTTVELSNWCISQGRYTRYPDAPEGTIYELAFDYTMRDAIRRKNTWGNLKDKAEKGVANR